MGGVGVNGGQLLSATSAAGSAVNGNLSSQEPLLNFDSSGKSKGKNGN